MKNTHIPEKAIENLWKRIEKGAQDWKDIIRNSLLILEQKKNLPP